MNFIILVPLHNNTGINNNDTIFIRARHHQSDWIWHRGALNVLINAKVSPLDTTSQPYLRHNISNSSPKFLGQVSARLRDFLFELSIEHRSRNNQLLWHALAEIEPKITACIEQFGRERIAVIIGTSTTGADENIPVFKAGVQGDYATEQFNQQQILFSAPSDFVAEVYA
ncbi:3-oxoacyl-(acyl carrier protein) synthase I [Mannheimia haemolytica]|uniref:3-oxoacyl-(Acyl carrier protein) synthase I n=1 Tax=Mannheimia haemolytica TaxID=75985 RepID=A0A378N0M0_MANHA|nr:3-oxoacyl-(acyl carrier protein) synthase I [Mannheimia haemolytica]